jgi:hypothetical protein
MEIAVFMARFMARAADLVKGGWPMDERNSLWVKPAV